MPHQNVFCSADCGSINVQFNTRESQAAAVKNWNKDEVHALRGRIIGQGDLFNDAECDIAEVVE